jgi:hypothetical protein
MPRLQFSLKTLLWWSALVALFAAQWSAMNRIWTACASREFPIVEAVWLLVVWIVGLKLLARREPLP